MLSSGNAHGGAATNASEHNRSELTTTNCGAASGQGLGGLDSGSNNAAAHGGSAAMGADDSMPTSVEDDQNYQFYKEYCRLYYANIILTNRLQQLLNEKKDLQFKLSRLEVRREQRQGLASSLPTV